MSVLLFHAPPLPYFMLCGSMSFERGQFHPARRSFGVFDLLVVKEGCLFMGEEEQHYTVQSGQALVLLPDRYHYATQPCTTDTHFFWLHFQANGPWLAQEQLTHLPIFPSDLPAQEESGDPIIVGEPFLFQCAQFCPLTMAASIYPLIETLIDLQKQPQVSARWNQQTLFLQLLQGMYQQPASVTEPAIQVAEMTAAFLRQHYQEPISYAHLQETLHFHHNYLARCMQRVFGCTPLQYLLNWRIEQARPLLLNTNLPIGQVAHEVGFHHLSYFIRCFTLRVGVTPQAYRKQFHL